MKKILLGVGAFFAGVVVLLLLAPLFYDVNTKVKPLIQGAIEENLEAKAEIGKLSLSTLWGINIGVESLKIIENKGGNVFFEMNNAKLKIPFYSLLFGKVPVTLSVDKPTVRMSRNKQGEFNFASLIKPLPKPSDTGIPKADAGAGAGSKVGVAIGSRVSFSTDITDAKVEFTDEKLGFNYKIDQIDLETKNVGLNQPFETLLSANLAVDNKKDIYLDGKVTVSGNTAIGFGSSGYESMRLNAAIDLTQVAMKYSNLFSKSKSVPLTLDASLNSSQNVFEIARLDLVANKFKIEVQGTIDQFDNPRMDISVKSNDLNLAEWKKIIKPLGEYDVEGISNFNLSVTGTADALAYQGRLLFKSGAATVPGLVKKATDIEAELDLKTNDLNIQKASMKIGSSEFKLNGSIKNFLEPVIRISFNSNKLNLDEMLPAPPATASAAGSQQKEEDPEALEKTLSQVAGPIALIRQNPYLKKMDLRAEATINSLVVKNAEIQNIKADANFKNLVFSTESASLKAFEGTGTASMKIDFNAIKPVYSAKAEIQKLDINSAIVSQFKDLDKTLTGQANAKFEVNGTGVLLADLNKNLKGTGNFLVNNGSWSGLGLLKVIGDKLKSIPKAGEALSGVKVSDKFKTLKSDFNISEGRLNIVNGIMELESANTSVTLGGYVAFNKDMVMRGDVVAPMGSVPKKLSTNDGRGKLPYLITGKANEPKVEWEETVKPVAAAYAVQEGEKLLQKGVEKVIKDDNIKKLFKGIKF